MTSEQAFLQNYDPKAFPAVLVTVDTVLLTYHEGDLKVLLVKRGNHPYLGYWGLPGGFLNQSLDLSLEDAARRSIEAKTGIQPHYVEQIQTQGSQDRDPRGWSVSVVYSALMPYQAATQHIDTVDNVAWVRLAELGELSLAFDHAALIEVAVERYRQKALYSFVPVFALPKAFTISQLRQVHEALIDKPIQRKSFLRRVEASGLFKDTGKTQQERGRPASLFEATKGIAEYRFTRNLES